MLDEEKDADEEREERTEDDWWQLSKAEADAARRISQIFTAWQELNAKSRMSVLTILCRNVHFSYAPRTTAELTHFATEGEKMKDPREEQIEALERRDDDAFERANRRILDSMLDRFQPSAPRLPPRPFRK